MFPNGYMSSSETETRGNEKKAKERPKEKVLE